jgi:TolB-like protein
MADMLRAILAFFLAAAIPSVVFGDGAATRPAVKVAIVPFDVIGDSGHEWIGHALQEGLASGLQKGSGISAIIVPGIVPVDANAAIAQGKSVDADVVIFGSVQVVDQTLRVGGRIVSVKSGETIEGLQNDGNLRGLFEIEDLLSERARRILAPANRAPTPRATRSATVEMVGPAVASAGPRYFDGDLASVISRPERFGDEYDRYYYHSASTSGWWQPCGPCGAIYGVCGYPGNGVLFPIAAPTRGW